MKPASRSFSTSFAIALLRSGTNILRLCYTGLHSRLTLTRCWITPLSIPGIPSCFQVKTSWFSLKKFVIFTFSKLKVLILSSRLWTDLQGRLQPLVELLLARGLVQVRLSSMCGFPLMLGQLDSILLQGLDLL